jgi:hypothetical protein
MRIIDSDYNDFSNKFDACQTASMVESRDFTDQCVEGSHAVTTSKQIRMSEYQLVFAGILRLEV